jgi:hypothetical protein
MEERFDQVDAHFDQADARFEQVDSRAADLKQHVDKTAEDLKQHFDLTVEDMRTDVQRVADGVLMVNEKLDREAAGIRTDAARICGHASRSCDSHTARNAPPSDDKLQQHPRDRRRQKVR